MVPGDTGTVKAEGTWAADKYLQVKVPTSVALTYGAQSMDVAITFDTMYKIGNSVEAVSAEHEIAVADASRLFGTWEGVLAYDVQLIEKGDINRDGVIDAADINTFQEYFGQKVTDGVSIYCDMNGDGNINNSDLIVLRAIFSQNGIATE